MCTVCGCGQPGNPPLHSHDHENARAHGHHHGHGHSHGHAHGHTHGHDHDHTHAHDEGHTHAHDGTLDFGAGPAGVHVPGLSPARIVQIEQDILGENDRYAAVNRRRLDGCATAALNLMSSPGSGKTTLLVRTVEHFAAALPVAVIEGDQQTDFDAERIRATGVPTVQVNTGKGCHLDAHMVGHALDDLPLPAGGLVFIENVGNLVCPAGFDLGETARVVMLSVTEGDDKPLKYPDMFHRADLVLLTKVDLLPYVPFDVERCLVFARRVNARVETLQVSALSGAGLDAWFAWVERRLHTARHTPDIAVAAEG